MFEQYTLPNKTRVILIPQEGTMSLTTQVMFPVGSRFESEKLSGVSHYIEHLMFKGTKRRKNTLTLTREIDRLGAEYNAFTGKEYTGYYIKADTSHAQTAIDILSDMLFYSTFDPKEMEREKTVICEEIKMYRDNPLMSIDNVFEEVMFAGCPMGRDIAGTEAHVLGFKRDEVLAYRDKYYQPDNMVVVLAGNIDDKVRGWIEQYFGGVHSTGKTFHVKKEADFGSVAKSSRLKVVQKQVDQAQLMLGFPAFDYNDSRNPASAVLHTILGGSMCSRLFIQVRERRGLAYMVRAKRETYSDIGYSYVRAGLDPKNTNKAIAVITDEIQKIVDKGVTPQELRDAKSHTNGALALALEDSSFRANWFAQESLFADKIQTPQEVAKKMDEVSNEDIKKVAKTIFKMNQMRVAVIGPNTDKEIMFK